MNPLLAQTSGPSAEAGVTEALANLSVMNVALIALVLTVIRLLRSGVVSSVGPSSKDRPTSEAPPAGTSRSNGIQSPADSTPADSRPTNDRERDGGCIRTAGRRGGGRPRRRRHGRCGWRCWRASGH